MNVDAGTIDAANKFIIDQGVAVMAFIIMAVLGLLATFVAFRFLAYLRELNTSQTEREKAESLFEGKSRDAEIARQKTVDAQQLQLINAFTGMTMGIDALRTVIADVQAGVSRDRELERDARTADREGFTAAVKIEAEKLKTVVDDQMGLLKKLRESVESVETAAKSLPEKLEGFQTQHVKINEVHVKQSSALDQILKHTHDLKKAVDTLATRLETQEKHLERIQFPPGKGDDTEPIVPVQKLVDRPPTPADKKPTNQTEKEVTDEPVEPAKKSLSAVSHSAAAGDANRSAGDPPGG